MSIKISKGQKVFLSQTGHKGFEYPTKESENLLFDVEAKSYPYVGGGNLISCSVPENSILALGDSNKSILVWVDKKTVKRL